MNYICQYCKREFSDTHTVRRYCSKKCAGIATSKRNQELRETKAKELGIKVDELGKLIKRGRMGLRPSQPKHYKYTKRPKTYREIQAENRRRPLVAGWRGAPVMGGGAIHHNDPYLKPSEYVRC